MMTRKHYEAIANVIKQNYEVSTDVVKFVLRDMTAMLSEVFAADNDRFDFKRFVKACGM